MPIATVEPLPQVSLDDEIRTFHAPSKVLALPLPVRQRDDNDGGEESLAKSVHDTPLGLIMR